MTSHTISKLISTFILLFTLNACASSPAKEVSEPERPEPLFLQKSGDTLDIGEVIDIEGNIVDLSDPNKRKLVILFATWCHDSQRALNHLSLSDLVDEEDLQIVAIAREESVETVAKFKDEQQFTFTMAADPSRKIYNKFANNGIPRLIMIGKDNVIIDHVLAENDAPMDMIRWK